MKIAISVINECIRIRFTYQGKRIEFYPGLPNTKKGNAIAGSIAAKIESDILNNLFDPANLGKYKISSKLKPPHLFLQTWSEIWAAYVEFKKPLVKEKTIDDTYTPIGNWIDRCPHKATTQKRETVAWLIANCKGKMARRVLMYLEAACKWAGIDLFDEEYKQLEKPDYELNPGARALTDEEVTTLLDGIAGHPKYKRYLPYVQFGLLTGCRLPSEALRLTWRDIGYDTILFTSTKTKKNRRFPLSHEIKAAIAPLCHSKEPLESFTVVQNEEILSQPVFQNINHNNFSRRCWKKFAPPDTTPYCLRDTFITRQLKGGIAPAVVAAWVGNSTQVIERHYADKLELSKVKPLSF
jgi:integrase